ncbi:hypothetical protein NA56DRAFT_61387 [Hyaloscypha hepaticicola]|uniref:Myb-like domain-containing protein n=1 Tax=Hyaloscypha hepaticicola TaxID=2082293 RepID=A0A2J6QA45_9HELO|nr:hypothetical protein NA56DRAFT_61387 [Hyaloscypha hepaticicola]
MSHTSWNIQPPCFELWYLADSVSSRWQLEKDDSGKLNGTKFWTLISAKLKESGFDRTSEQCRSYWYGTLRVRQEFKDTLQFRSTSGCNGTPTVATSKNLTAVNEEPSKDRTRSDSAALFSTVAEESKAVSPVKNYKMLQAMAVTGDTPGSMHQAAAENGLEFMPETTGVIDDEGDTTISMSRPSTSNGSISRWTERETQKLTELVSAKRNSMAIDGKGAGVAAFWKSISLDLENNQIHRSWHACMRRFSRVNGGESGTVEPAMDPDATHSSLFYVEPYNDDKGQTTHPKSTIDHSDDGEADYDGSKSELDGDTPYGEDEDGALRRGARKRVSRPAWTDEEHNRLVQLVKARRQLESEDPKLIKLNPSKLFALVSKQ